MVRLLEKAPPMDEGAVRDFLRDGMDELWTDAWSKVDLSTPLDQWYIGEHLLVIRQDCNLFNAARLFEKRGFGEGTCESVEAAIEKYHQLVENYETRSNTPMLPDLDSDRKPFYNI